MLYIKWKIIWNLVLAINFFALIVLSKFYSYENKIEIYWFNSRDAPSKIIITILFLNVTNMN